MTKKLLPCLVAAAALIQAQNATVRPATIADITGDGAAHQLQTSGRARWVLLIAPASNASVVRVGDLNVSSTRGAAIAAGGGLMMPPIAGDAGGATADHFYDLTAIYYLAASGDKVSVTWGN